LVAVNLSSWDFVSWEESGEWSGWETINLRFKPYISIWYYW
jgi:hypothetical protein